LKVSAGERPNKPRIIVVGARTARQGTGPFIAAAFARLGAEVCALVGTRPETVEQARSALATRYQINSRGYTELPDALSSEQPDAVAICSPYRFHAEQLAQIAAAGCHALVEKPLAWPAGEDQVAALVSGFSQRGLLLQLVNQWPQSLAAFTALHGAVPGHISRFTMGLSPISIGASMISDSAPHFIGMLQALLGPGECGDPEVQLSRPEAAGEGQSYQQLILECNYRHSTGVCRAQLQLKTCLERPRPAWYQINDLRVDRKIHLPEYSQQLVSGNRSAALADPMEATVQSFVNDLGKKTPTDDAALVRNHRNLQQLAAAMSALD
jgi:Oxidoreductase family, NAD-binding Rossmann fold